MLLILPQKSVSHDSVSVQNPLEPNVRHVESKILPVNLGRLMFVRCVQSLFSLKIYSVYLSGIYSKIEISRFLKFLKKRNFKNSQYLPNRFLFRLLSGTFWEKSFRQRTFCRVLTCETLWQHRSKNSRYVSTLGWQYTVVIFLVTTNNPYTQQTLATF